MTIKAEYLVVDSGGFFKNAPLRDLATNLVTLQEVLGEIKDKETRQWLEVMPFDMTYKHPSAESVKRISDFAKKTGDYSSLSAVDIRVLAVTYELEVEMVGASHLRTEPVIKKTTEFYHPKVDKDKINKSDAKLPGFFMGKECASEVGLKKSESFDQFNFWREPLLDLGDIALDDEAGDTITKSETQPNLASIIGGNVVEKQVDMLDSYLLKRSFFCGVEVSGVDFAVMEFVKELIINENSHSNLFRWSTNVSSYEVIAYQEVDIMKVMEHVEKNEEIVFDKVGITDDVEESSEDFQENLSDDDFGYDSDKENDEDISDDDEDGWITPGNVKNKKAVYNGTEDGSAPEKVMVACMTTDFAMQNVCKQLGLNLIGTNGMMIKETKTWILRCYGCFKTTPLMDRKFCPKCGNKTLKRVSVTLNKDGSQQVHISTRRQLTAKGKKFSLPAPKGGKHAVNPRLVEDQREAQQRLSKKALKKNNPMGDDFVAGNSPFTAKDVTSKSAMLGLQGSGKGNAEVPGAYWNRRNPNAVKKNTGNRKK
jgi:RNA-binding protein NOB1